MNNGSYTYNLFARHDFSAFWALFTDNLINLIVLSSICQFVFNMPADIVFGRIVPGAAIAILAGIAVYTVLARCMNTAVRLPRCPTVSARRSCLSICSASSARMV